MPTNSPKVVSLSQRRGSAMTPANISSACQFFTALHVSRSVR